MVICAVLSRSAAATSGAAYSIRFQVSNVREPFSLDQVGRQRERRAREADEGHSARKLPPQDADRLEHERDLGFDLGTARRATSDAVATGGSTDGPA
jgi:hypothetical protein